MKYYWLILILLFMVKILQGKQLSSYNIKWMIVYVVYVLICHAVEFDNFFFKSYDATEIYIWWVFLIPLMLYMIFPFIWKYIGSWKPFKLIDKFIDKWYRTIKELNQ